MVDSIGEQEHGDGCLDGVLARRDGLEADRIRALARAGVGAGKTDLTGEKRKHDDRPAVQLAVATTLRTPALNNEQRLSGADLVRELLDLLGVDTRDGSSPLGSLLHMIVARSHDVVLIGLVLALGGLGHRVLVKADAVLVEELLVDHVVLDELIGDRRAQRGVSARVDRQPLGRTAHVRVVETRVDVDDLRAGLLAHAHPVAMGHGAALTGLRGARAECEDELGVIGSAERRAIETRSTEGVRNYCFHLHGAVVAIAAQKTAEAVHEAGKRASRGRAYACRIGNEHGLVSISVDDALELAGDSVNGLVPSDLLEFALTALADSLHRVVDAIRVG